MWTDMVTSAVVDYEREAYRTRTLNDADFTRFREVHNDCFTSGVLWAVACEIPGSLEKSAFQARLLTYPLSKHIGKPLLCEYCGAVFTDPIVHHIAFCPEHQVERDRFWDFLTDKCPLELSVILHNMEEDLLVSCLLGGPIDEEVLSREMHYIFLYRAALFMYRLREYIEPYMLFW